MTTDRSRSPLSMLISKSLFQEGAKKHNLFH